MDSEFVKKYIITRAYLKSVQLISRIIIVSMAAPTDKGIKIAETANLTLIGFARGGRFNIYTNPERIIQKNPENSRIYSERYLFIVAFQIAFPFRYVKV